MNPGGPTLADVTMLISPEPWSALPTNKHQIAKRLAAAGETVYYVDWNGRSLISWVKGLSEACGADRDGVLQICPPRLPIRLTRRSAIALSVDSLLKCIVLLFVLRLKQVRCGLVITYVPVSYMLVRRIRKSVPVLYHCVDDVGSFPEWEKSVMCRDLIYRNERSLVLAADVTMCSSRPLYEKCIGIAGSVVFWPNVGDFALFSSAAGVDEDCPPELADLKRPIVFFHGNLVEHKVDFDLIADLANQLNPGTVVLVGPIEPSLAQGLLRRVPKGALVLLPAASQEEVVRYIQHVELLLLPYVMSVHTNSVFPLKVMEYLATGKPIVSVPLPSIVTACGSTVTYCSSAVEVVAELRNADICCAKKTERQAIAFANSWENRMRELTDLVRDINARRRQCE